MSDVKLAPQQVKTALQLPDTFSVKKDFNLETVGDAPKVQQMEAVFADALSKAKMAKYGKYGITVLAFIIAFGAKGFFMALVFGALAYGIGVVALKFFNKRAEVAMAMYSDAKWDHVVFLADAIATKMGGRVYANEQGQILVYSNNGCTYAHAYEGQVVGLNKENIKEVMLERVSLGSTTTGSQVSNSTGKTSGSVGEFTNTFSARTNTTTVTQMNSSTVQHYEWHLDILSDYIQYPRIDFILPDGKEGEATAKTIYAVLKP